MNRKTHLFCMIRKQQKKYFIRGILNPLITCFQTFNVKAKSYEDFSLDDSSLKLERIGYIVEFESNALMYLKTKTAISLLSSILCLESDFNNDLFYMDYMDTFNREKVLTMFDQLKKDFLGMQTSVLHHPELSEIEKAALLELIDNLKNFQFRCVTALLKSKSSH